MDRILSKEEIADLLSAVKHGEIEIDPAAEEESATVVVDRLDLFRSRGPENWKFPNFDLILDAFARNYSTALVNRLQRSIEIKLSGFESMAFKELLQKLSGHGAIGVVALEPLRGNAMVIFDEILSYALVEMMLGGSFETQLIPDREMTAIELNVIRDVVGDSCPELEKSFTPMQEVKASLVKIENNLRLISHIGREAGVLVAHYQVTLDAIEGEVTLVLPHSALDPLRKKQHEQAFPMSAVRTDQWRQAVIGKLGGMEVEIEAQLAHVSLRIKDILNFQVGDVIDLDCGPDSPLQLRVEGRPKFEGIAGVQGRNKAILVTGEIPAGG